MARETREQRAIRKQEAATRGMSPMGTHLPILAAACSATNGPIVEIGGGLFSTPLIHGFSAERFVLTVETVPEWYEKVRRWETDHHKVLLARRVGAIEKAVRQFIDECERIGQRGRFAPLGVMFVDGEKETRLPAIQLGRKLADVVVAHDYEAKLSYRYNWAFNGVRKFAAFDKLIPSTAVCSEAEGFSMDWVLDL